MRSGSNWRRPELRAWSSQARKAAWQGPSLLAGVAKDNGSAVALMHVAINRHGALDELALLQATDGDSEVVQHTEAFAVIGVGVVKAAANADADSVSHGALSGKDRTAGVEHEGVHYLLRERELLLQFL